MLYSCIPKKKQIRKQNQCQKKNICLLIRRYIPRLFVCSHCLQPIPIQLRTNNKNKNIIYPSFYHTQVHLPIPLFTVHAYTNPHTLTCLCTTYSLQKNKIYSIKRNIPKTVWGVFGLLFISTFSFNSILSGGDSLHKQLQNDERYSLELETQTREYMLWIGIMERTHVGCWGGWW